MSIDGGELLSRLRKMLGDIEARRCITIAQEREKAFTAAGIRDAIATVELMIEEG